MLLYFWGERAKISLGRHILIFTEHTELDTNPIGDLWISIFYYFS
jgi:hypothetical protein